MKLRVKSRYANQPLSVDYKAGQVVEVDEKLGAILLADSPEAFEVVLEEVEPEPAKATKRVGKV
jgi:hypothetical protein